MTPPPRRNEPCPCGSGRRYKDCHGQLAAAPVGPVPLERLVERALQAHQQGRVDEAVRGYREILERSPGHAVATHYLGLAAWHRGEVDEAERAMRAAIAADASVPDFHNNLALLLRDAGRTEEAIAGFGRAIAADPGWAEAHANLGLALEDAGRWEESEAACRAGLAADARSPTVHQNLARVLLARGRFAQAWDHYRWRLLAQGRVAQPPGPASSLPQDLAHRRLALLAEQGVGDVLFFLRFAPLLARRGAQLAFRGDPRLHPLLARTGLFTLGLGHEADPAPGLEPLFIGDLPGLLEATDAHALPGALTLVPGAASSKVMEERLAALGPAPRIGLTWRSGVPSAPGPSRTQVKQVPPEALGRALRGLAATWVSVQRSPVAGEREALEAALGARVHDFSAVNADLDQALAAQAHLDHYVGTSNANTHLRAGLGRRQHVLVPDPAEWRWLAHGEASPWFPGFTVHRPVRGDWAPALAGLRERLAGALGRG